MLGLGSFPIGVLFEELERFLGVKMMWHLGAKVSGAVE